MQLNRRIVREFNKNFVSYIAIFLMVVMSGFLVVSFSGTTFTVRDSVENGWAEQNVEDGEFILSKKISKGDIADLEREGVVIEEMFFMDLSADNDTVLRLFANREKINTLVLSNGYSAAADNEIALEYTFAEFVDFEIGSTVSAGNRQFVIAGTGTVPDYAHRTANISDVGTDDYFGIGFITKPAFDRLAGSKEYSSKVIYNYSFKLMEGTEASIIKDKVAETGTLRSFVEKDRNARITSIIQYNASMLSYAIMVGALFSLIIAFILSVFIVNLLEQDSVAIGTLYALGYTKGELVRHYIVLPVITVAIGALLGTLLGTQGVTLFVANHYSYPPLTGVVSPSMLLYGIAMPIVFSVIINLYVLSRKLNAQPLFLLRGGQKLKDISTAKLNNLSFITMFRTRQFLREMRSYCVIFVGFGLSILLLMLGFSLYSTIEHYADTVGEDMQYENMYLLNAPLEEQPTSTERALTKSYTIYCEQAGADLDVVLQGVESGSIYFDFAEQLKDDPQLVYVSDSAVVKYGYKEGDFVTFTDNLMDRYDTFKIAGTVPFKNGIYFFMDIDAMRTRFEVDDSYYNTLFSNKDVSISDELLVSTVNRVTVADTAQGWIDSGRSYLYIFMGVAVLTFVIMSYILFRMMVDRTAYSIALMKIFGFSEGLVRRIYLGGNLFILAVACVVFFPVSANLMVTIIPSLNGAMGSGMATYIDIRYYIMMLAVVTLTYGILNFLLGRYLRKVPMSRVLKNVG